MKKLLFILFTLISVSASAQLKATAPWFRNFPTDTGYAVTYANLQQGGYQTTTNFTTRNAIPFSQRDTGMMVKYEASDSIFTLSGGIANSNWVLFSASGGAGAGTVFSVATTYPVQGGTITGSGTINLDTINNGGVASNYDVANTDSVGILIKGGYQATPIDTAYTNAVSNVIGISPITVTTGGKTKYVGADTTILATQYDLVGISSSIPGNVNEVLISDGAGSVTTYPYFFFDGSSFIVGNAGYPAGLLYVGGDAAILGDGDAAVNGTQLYVKDGNKYIYMFSDSVAISNLSAGGMVVASAPNGKLSVQAIPTGTVNSLNALTGASQTFATGTTGTDFGISSSGTVHTFNIPSASATVRGLITTGTQTIAGAKTFSSTIVGSVNGNAATVTTNANLTGPVTSSGNATSVTNNAITNAMLAQLAGLSVLGVTGNSTANVAAITAGTDNYALRRSGSSVAFGLIDSLSTVNIVSKVWRKPGSDSVFTYKNSSKVFAFLDSIGSGGGTPAGSDTWIQRNNSGAFGASDLLTHDPTTEIFNVNSSSFGEPLLIVDGLNGLVSAGSITNGVNFQIDVGFGSLNFNSPGGNIMFDASTAYFTATTPLQLQANIGLGNKTLYTDNSGYVQTQPSGSATLNFGSIAGGASDTLGFAVSLASVGDPVAVGAATFNLNLFYTGHVRVANWVTIMATNNNAVTAIDPASATFKAQIFK